MIHLCKIGSDIISYEMIEDNVEISFLKAWLSWPKSSTLHSPRPEESVLVWWKCENNPPFGVWIGWIHCNDFFFFPSSFLSAYAICWQYALHVVWCDCFYALFLPLPFLLFPTNAPPIPPQHWWLSLRNKTRILKMNIFLVPPPLTCTIQEKSIQMLTIREQKHKFRGVNFQPPFLRQMACWFTT